MDNRHPVPLCFLQDTVTGFSRYRNRKERDFPLNNLPAGVFPDFLKCGIGEMLSSSVLPSFKGELSRFVITVNS